MESKKEQEEYITATPTDIEEGKVVRSY